MLLCGTISKANIDRIWEENVRSYSFIAKLTLPLLIQIHIKEITISSAVWCTRGMKKLACSDIGLDCGYIIEGEREQDIINNAKQHIWEVHAIKQGEMTSEMKAKITQNIRDS